MSRSGFYDWVRGEPSARAVRRAKVTEHVKAGFTFGLTHSGDPMVAFVTLELVRKLMQENDLHACRPRA